MYKTSNVSVQKRFMSKSVVWISYKNVFKDEPVISYGMGNGASIRMEWEIARKSALYM